MEQARKSRGGHLWPHGFFVGVWRGAEQLDGTRFVGRHHRGAHGSGLDVYVAHQREQTKVCAHLGRYERSALEHIAALWRRLMPGRWHERSGADESDWHVCDGASARVSFCVDGGAHGHHAVDDRADEQCGAGDHLHPRGDCDCAGRGRKSGAVCGECGHSLQLCVYAADRYTAQRYCIWNGAHQNGADDKGRFVVKYRWDCGDFGSGLDGGAVGFLGRG